MSYGRELSVRKRTNDFTLGDSWFAQVSELTNETRSMKDRSAQIEVALQTVSGEIVDLRSEVQRLNKNSMTDALTQIANRRAFDRNLAAMMEEAQRTSQPLSLVLVDIDRFKAFNDSYGHVAGDQVIRFVAKELSSGTKGRYFVARYGARNTP